VFRDAGIIVGVAALVAFSTNVLRSDRLPLVATKEYDIAVPCPEPLGHAEAIVAGDPRISDPKTLLIDVRTPEEFSAWHLPGAMNTPFDWLSEQEEITRQSQVVARDVARSGKQAVVVYGEGGDPDSGQQWAALLNNAGIRNVYYVEGGAPALSGRAPAKEAP